MSLGKYDNNSLSLALFDVILGRLLESMTVRNQNTQFYIPYPALAIEKLGNKNWNWTEFLKYFKKVLSLDEFFVSNLTLSKVGDFHTTSGGNR